MTLKQSLPIAIAIALLGLRRTCPPTRPVAEGQTWGRGATCPEVVADVPPKVAPVTNPATCDAAKRNLFSFVDPVPPRPAMRRQPLVVAVKQPQTQVEQPKVEVLQQPEPVFPYRYIGNFGPAASPIAVFVASNEVVNARPGDAVGSFRLTRVGVESVEVASASGAVRRVALQP